MRIHIVCRQNQARSLVASALLRQHYPNFEIFSSGIQAKTGNPIPPIIHQIANRWGLDLLDHFSTNFKDGETLQESDLVICADKAIHSHLAGLNLPGSLLNVQQWSLADFLLPFDPMGVSPFEIEVELAKMIIATASTVVAHIGFSRSSNISALIYTRAKKILYMNT